MLVVVIGVVLVILAGITYINYNNGRNQFLAQLQAAPDKLPADQLSHNEYLLLQQSAMAQLHGKH